MKPTLQYQPEEDGSTSLVYFILVSSRSERADKRSELIRYAARFAPDDITRAEIHDLASQIQDVEQYTQRYLAEFRAASKRQLADIADGDNLQWLLEQIETQPMEERVQLLGSLGDDLVPEAATLNEHWWAAYGAARLFEVQLETVLFSIRNYLGRMTNAAAAVALAAEDAARADDQPNPEGDTPAAS